MMQKHSGGGNKVTLLLEYVCVDCREVAKIVLLTVCDSVLQRYQNTATLQPNQATCIVIHLHTCLKIKKQATHKLQGNVLTRIDRVLFAVL